MRDFWVKIWVVKVVNIENVFLRYVVEQNEPQNIGKWEDLKVCLILQDNQVSIEVSGIKVETKVEKVTEQDSTDNIREVSNVRII